MRSALLSICFLSFCKGDLVEILGDDQEAVMQNTNFYEILGVDPKADLQEIKEAFRNLALTKHPDRFANLDGSAKEAVKKVYSTISEAYETLRDAKKRASYDARLPIIDVQNLVHALRDSSFLPTPVKSFVKQVGHTLDRISESKDQELSLKAQIREIRENDEDGNWKLFWGKIQAQLKYQAELRRNLEKLMLNHRSMMTYVPILGEKVQVILEILWDAEQRESYDARLSIIELQNVVHAIRDLSSLPTPVKSFLGQVGHILDRISESKDQELSLKAQIREIRENHEDGNWKLFWGKIQAQLKYQAELRQYLERMIHHPNIGLVPREIRESLVEKVQVIFEKLDIKEKFVHPELRNFFEQITWLIAGQSAAEEMGVALLEPEVPRETDVQIMGSAEYWSQLAFVAALSLAALRLENVLPRIGGQV